MIAGKNIVHCLPRVNDHNAVFRCCREQDMVAGFDIVEPSRRSRDNDAGPQGHGEKTIGGSDNYDGARAGITSSLSPGCQPRARTISRFEILPDASTRPTP